MARVASYSPSTGFKTTLSTTRWSDSRAAAGPSRTGAPARGIGFESVFRCFSGTANSLPASLRSSPGRPLPGTEPKVEPHAADALTMQGGRDIEQPAALKVEQLLAGIDGPLGDLDHEHIADVLYDLKPEVGRPSPGHVGHHVDGAAVAFPRLDGPGHVVEHARLLGLFIYGSTDERRVDSRRGSVVTRVAGKSPGGVAPDGRT